MSGPTKNFSGNSVTSREDVEQGLLLRATSDALLDYRKLIGTFLQLMWEDIPITEPL